MSEWWKRSTATEIAIGEVSDHPLNDNVMEPGMERTLQTHIKENEGLYPRLIVREIPEDSEYYSPDGPKFQFLDGVQRRNNLKVLGIDPIAVDIWPDVSDKSAIRILATMNHIHGASVVGLRANLLAEFEKHWDEPEDAAIFLTESPEELKQFEQVFAADVARADAESAALSVAATATEPNDSDELVVLELFAVYTDQKTVIDLAIENVSSQLKGKNKRGRALELIAAYWIAGEQQVDPTWVESSPMEPRVE
jgi:hypothetical protein